MSEQQQPQMDPGIGAQIVITMFKDGRPPAFESTVDYITALRIIGGVIMGIAGNLQQGGRKPLPPMEDRKREYLGARETVSYGEGKDAATPDA